VTGPRRALSDLLLSVARLLAAAGEALVRAARRLRPDRGEGAA
jgi:hypothetical protein